MGVYCYIASCVVVSLTRSGRLNVYIEGAQVITSKTVFLALKIEFV